MSQFVDGPKRSQVRSRAERLMAARPKQELPEREELVRLFSHYDVTAPRYTSYPPATQFSTTFDRSILIDRLARSERGNEVSIYVHLPFCDTLCYFCGCTMMISNNREKIAEYLDYLKREITMASELMEPATVVQMHWGGGTPTHLLPEEIESLADHLRRTFHFSPQAEVSIEIDPRGLTERHVQALEYAGFNRASIGVQDFSDDVQIAVNRVQPRDMTEEVIGWCRNAGINSLNLDLIYGLPFQTTTSFAETLRAVTELSPDRIAVYNFAYVPWIKPHQQLIPLETLPTATNKLALLELAIRDLTSAGYDYLGMDHFARPTDALAEAQRAGTLHRNFQGYSTLAGKDLLAFGISAIGRIENVFSQNVKDLPSYYGMIQSGNLPIDKGYELSPADQVREFVIMQLMCNLHVSKADTERLFGIGFDDYFTTSISALASLEADGLCELTSREIRITQLGRFFLRNIAMQFDQYLPQTSATRPMFSRAL